MHKLISRNIYTNRLKVNVNNFFINTVTREQHSKGILEHLILKSSSCIMCFIRGHLIVYMTWGGGGGGKWFIKDVSTQKADT